MTAWRRTERRAATASGAWLIAATVAAGLPAAPHALAALQQQETPAPRGAAGAPGWLGIRFLTNNYECEWDARERWKPCELVLRVQQVETGGPAHEAGVRPGDRLLALNGRDLTAESMPGLFGSVRPGTPVSLDVRRDGERRFVRIVPRRRPVDAARVRWHPASERSLVIERSPSRTYVVTLGPARGEGGELVLADSGVVFALTVREEGPRVQVQPSAVRMVDGQVRVSAFEDATDLARAFPMVRIDLARELRALQDSSYRAAARALKSVEGRLRSQSGGWVVVGPGGRAQGRVEVFQRAFGRWMAGAEFEPIGDGLARALETTDEGLLVLRVLPGTPAHRMGLQPGDVVTEAGGEKSADLETLRRVLLHGPDDEPILVKWVRKGTVMSGLLHGG